MKFVAGAIGAVVCGGSLWYLRDNYSAFRVPAAGKRSLALDGAGNRKKAKHRSASLSKIKKETVGRLFFLFAVPRWNFAWIGVSSPGAEICPFCDPFCDKFFFGFGPLRSFSVWRKVHLIIER